VLVLAVLLALLLDSKSQLTHCLLAAQSLTVQAIDAQVLTAHT
jgi:hypothetical protein